jgi:hypothetical protein
MHLSHLFTSMLKPAAYKSFDCCLSHFRTWLGIICDFSMSLKEFIDPVVNRFMRQTLATINRKHLFVNNLCIESFWPQKTHNTALRKYTPEAQSPFWLLKAASEHVHVCLLPTRLSWSWIVPPPSDTHRNLLRPLQLFYFHLWTIYWLSLIVLSLYLEVFSSKLPGLLAFLPELSVFPVCWNSTMGYTTTSSQSLRSHLISFDAV